MMKKVLLSFTMLLILFIFTKAQPGTLDPSFNLGGSGANGTVYAVAVQADGKIILGGDFTSYNGVASSKLVRLNSDGSIDNSFNVGIGVNSAGTVYDIEIQADGKIFIAGYITNYAGSITNMIARLNTDGSKDLSFNSGATNIVYDLAIQQDGKIIIAGIFTSYGGNTSVTRLARINADGTLDASFNAGTGPNTTARTVAIQSDGKVLVGGNFTAYNGTATNGLARTNTNGSIDMSFDGNIGTGTNGQVWKLMILSTGEIMVAGEFSTFGGLSASRIVKLTSGGLIESNFFSNLGSGFFGTVKTLALESGDDILVGGSISQYKGSNIPFGITRLSSTAVRESAFNAGNTGSDFGEVNAIALDNDGKIMIAGDFTTYNGVTVNRIARLNASCTVNIPDANFKASLLGNTTINTNGNTEIECSEAQAFTGTINCQSLGITDMTGIEAFTSLTGLACNNNAFSTLDLSANVALELLYVYSNSNLTSVNLSNCQALDEYLGQFTAITSLDFSGCPNIVDINCSGASGNSFLQSLNLNGCTQLETLNCIFQLLPSINLSTNTALREVGINGNPISNFNLSNNSNLRSFSCGVTQISSLDVSANANLENLQVFNCNQLAALNMANGNNANFIGLSIYGNSNLSCVNIDDADTTGYAWAGSAFNLESGLVFSDACPTSCEVFSTDVQTACDSYTWIDGNTYTSSINTPTYTIVGGSAAGCDSIITLELTINASPSLSITENNGLLTATSGLNAYAWYVDGILINGSNTDTYSPTQNGAYYCTATENGCESTSNTINFVGTAINNLYLNSSNYYPNPVKDFLNVALTEASYVSIFDLSGRRVLESESAKQNHLINLSRLGSGMYILKTDLGIAKFLKD